MWENTDKGNIMRCAQRAVLLTVNKCAVSKILKRLESNCIKSARHRDEKLLFYFLQSSSLAFHSSLEKKLFKNLI